MTGCSNLRRPVCLVEETAFEGVYDYLEESIAADRVIVVVGDGGADLAAARMPTAKA